MTRRIAIRRLWLALGGLLLVLVLLAGCKETEESASPSPTPTPIVTTTAQASPASTPTPELTPKPTQKATPVATPTGPDLGALQQMADPAAKNLSMGEFELNDETFAKLAYDLQERVASPGIGSQGGVMDADRQYLEVYRWADGSWERAFNLYEFLPAIYPLEQLGPVVDNKPQTATAVVHAELTPVQFEAEIGDVLFLETGLEGGPQGVQHPAPTITALVWRDGELHAAYSEEFAVRGEMVSVRAAGEYIELVMDAYLSTDPMCCPTGWEMLRLAPTELGDLNPVERCTGPENHYCFVQ
ncbi:MAG: hypothetical protein MUP14_03530 [Dehalococcoidia bacterium]|nr:hypothetical protein [Dehalococcoidia bacterium]